MNYGDPPVPNSFFTSVGTGLASNTTLKTLNLAGITRVERGHVAALFESGLDRNTGLEDLHLDVDGLSDAQVLVSGLDRMAKQCSTKRSVDGSHRVSTLKKLNFTFCGDRDDNKWDKLVLDCLVRNRAYFALEELHLMCRGCHYPICDTSHLVKLNAFIQAFPTATDLTRRGYCKVTDDPNLTLLADTLENSTTVTQFQVGDILATGTLESMNRWSPADCPNHTRILCSVLRNKRELSMLLNSSNRRLLPPALATLLKPSKYEAEHVLNLNHALYLVQNLPELFSTDGRSGGGGGSEKVDSVEN